MTYDSWLQMAPEERDDMHAGWNAYARESICIPIMAAARLAMDSSVPVLDASVGTFHGGEYILHLTVRRSDVEKCPPFLSQTFEGFRVAWIADPGPPDNLAEHPLMGSWKSCGDGGEYGIHISVEIGALSVKCHAPSESGPLPVELPSCLESSVQFFTKLRGVEQRHGLLYDHDEPDRVRHEIATYQYGDRDTTQADRPPRSADG